MCAVCFLSCVILNLSPNILLDSRKSFFVLLHYFRTSAALRFKLGIRVPGICREISKRVSHLNNSVGNAAEACSFRRVLIAVSKCLQPNSLPIALLCYFLPNYIFVIYISLRGTKVQLSQGTRCRQFRPFNFQTGCFLSSLDNPLQWLQLPDRLGSHQVLHLDSYPNTLGDRNGCTLTTRSPESLAPVQFTRHLCDTCTLSLGHRAL